MQHLAAQHATASSDGNLSNSSNGVPTLQPTPHMHMLTCKSVTDGEFNGGLAQAMEWNAHLDVLHAHGSVQHPKSQEAAKVLRHEHSIEAHDRDAGCFNGAQDDKGGVRHIQPAVHATQEDAC